MPNNFNNQIKVELLESLGNDRGICQTAWVSSLDLETQQERTTDDVQRLIGFLAKHSHGTPFESVVFKFWIKMPIQTDRQHVTHRIASHNGMSGRYRTMPDEFYEIPSDVKDILSKTESTRLWDEEYLKICTMANETYNDFLKDMKKLEKNKIITNTEYKRVREFYRGMLPQNNMTERVTVMNLRSFANYQKLRNSPHAQLEIQEVARLMLEAVKKANICPIAIEMLEGNNWNL